MFPFQIILILCFAAFAAAKSPISLHNSLEPPLDYIPVNSGVDIASSKIPAGSKPKAFEAPQAQNFAGDKYITPFCPDGGKPPCATQTCPNGRPPPCTCPPPLVGTPPNCRGSKYLPIVRPKVPQCPK